MSLGVLNNLSAVYAENNLNSTNNSLSKTLQQLSSGSRINSGADDAAGLSLVDGLQANQQALNQSETNTTEGIGMLQVADGALSQVTSLLNRAVTLATEASNGTLNTTQDAAANQEYQSILSEINNIGKTTTYNQNQVFTGSASGTAIYTGDSSQQSASIDDLYFAPLTSSSVGDAGGTVVQSSSGIFVDLSKDTGGALTTAATETGANAAIAGGIKFTITNADGSTSTVDTDSATTPATTVGGLITEINQLGIPGVVASFTTAGAIGNPGGVNVGDTGILLTNTNSNVVIAAGSTALKDTGTGITGTYATKSTTATETIQYVTAASGDTTANLSLTDLTTQGDAETALTALNGAIADVAAQDGYIGAQINTLSSVSNVISTQQENVQSAQNAVQATDYAAASSNMSKYEILSQTGISALAQANSSQQEVLKLLQ
ncbi:MAG TPA: flagellin [Terracidiphilus sp.]|nr:flagellin [Terracidiphilus sp.]